MRPATCHMSQEMATVNNAISCSGSRIPSSKNKIPEFSFYKFLVNSGTCQSLVKSRFSLSFGRDFTLLSFFLEPFSGSLFLFSENWFRKKRDLLIRVYP